MARGRKRKILEPATPNIPVESTDDDVEKVLNNQDRFEKTQRMLENTNTPLAAYLRANGVPITAFARAMGVPFRSVYQWLQGLNCPTLASAWMIEWVTKGVVPMECWLAHPAIRAQLADWKSKQPEDMQKLPSVQTEAGGFAQPFKVPNAKKYKRRGPAPKNPQEPPEGA